MILSPSLFHFSAPNTGLTFQNPAVWLQRSQTRTILILAWSVAVVPLDDSIPCFTDALWFRFQLTAVRKIPWAKANINHTGQALLISAGKICFALFCSLQIQTTLCGSFSYEYSRIMVTDLFAFLFLLQPPLLHLSSLQIKPSQNALKKMFSMREQPKMAG